MSRYFFLYLFTISVYTIHCQYTIPDEVPLVVLTYAERNVTIYASSSNPSREPKSWVFWYDPLLAFDPEKDLQQFNEYVRFKFSLSSAEFDKMARNAIVSKMHPDVQRLALFWRVEPLPIDTFNVYVTNQKDLAVSGVFPCLKVKLAGTNTHECAFQTSSMFMANWIIQNIICGKFRIQVEYYVQSSKNSKVIPKTIATTLNLNTLRNVFGVVKYFHRLQANNILERYLINLQKIDNTIADARIQKVFETAIKLISRYELEDWSEMLQGNQIESIINQDLFYTSYRSQNQVLFHLKSSNSLWLLSAEGKQIFNIAEMQKLISDQLNIQAFWSSESNRWKIKSIDAYLLADMLDYLQIVLINQQYNKDKQEAHFSRTVDCADWSETCSCQTKEPTLTFISNTQLVRIPNIQFDFVTSGFTIEMHVRPGALPQDSRPVRLLNFREEFYVTYQRKGLITFSVADKSQPNIYTTSLQSFRPHQWSQFAGVYSPVSKRLTLYVNGEYVSSVPYTLTRRYQNTDIIIGQQFIGSVKDIRLWTCALTYDEVRKSSRTSYLNGNETCLVGYWPMQDGFGQIVQDTIQELTPHHGYLGFDDEPNLLTDPIWSHVLPIEAPGTADSSQPPTSPPPSFTFRTFLENVTAPVVAFWGVPPFDMPAPSDYDGDGFADFTIYRPIGMIWMSASTLHPNIMKVQQWGIPGDIPAQGNYDGDKAADFTVFRPSTGEWISHLSSNPLFGYRHRWGRLGDKVAMGDYDGDKKTDPTVYRNGIFYVNPSSDPSIQWTKQWGQADDTPVPNCEFDEDTRSEFTVWSTKTGIFSWIPSTAPWHIYQKQWGFRGDRAFCADFDGDKRDDFVIYRNYTGEWYVSPFRLSGVLITFQWGTPNDIAVGGDFDGDGKGEFSLWRPRKNGPYIWEIIPGFAPVGTFQKGWGFEGDIPVNGDFNGDKRTDFTVWRPTTGYWYILLSGSPGIQQIKHWGFTMNETALAGDWDGDFITDYTIYRPSTGYWYIMLSKNPILQIFMHWGSPAFEDVPAPGDFDGDGIYDFTVWRPSTGLWFILPSTNPAHVIIVQWGIKGDVPITGVDFDGDGKTDIAVWRPSTGSWYILPSSNPVYPFLGPNIIKQPTVQLPLPSEAIPAPIPVPQR